MQMQRKQPQEGSGNVWRGTRYNLTGNPPEQFNQVAKAIEKDAKRYNYNYSSRDPIRSIICQKAELERPPADEYVRFLINTHIVIEDEANKLWWVDVDRFDHIKYCIKEGCMMTPPIETPLERIDALKLKAIRGKQRQPDVIEVRETKATAASTRTATPTAARLTLVNANDPSTSPAEQDSAKETTASTQPLEFDLGNDAEVMETMRDVIVKHTRSFTLYLTPIEEAVWVELYLRATAIDGEERVGIPENGFLTDPSWKPKGILCSEEEYVEAMRRFTTCGILEYMGEGKPGIGKAPFRFVIPPDCFTIVKIERRVPIKTQQAYLDIVRCVQMGQFNPTRMNTNAELESWLFSRFPNVNPETARWKLLGYRGIEYIEERAGGWGIITINKSGLPSFCWPGFEPGTFELVDGEPTRQFRKNSSRSKKPWNIRPGQETADNDAQQSSTVDQAAEESSTATEQATAPEQPSEPVEAVVTESSPSDVTEPVSAAEEPVMAEVTQPEELNTTPVQSVAETRNDDVVESLSSEALDAKEQLLRQTIANAQEAIRLAEAKIELITLERQRREEEAKRRKAEVMRLEAAREAIAQEEREAKERIAKLQTQRDMIEAELAALRN